MIFGSEDKAYLSPLQKLASALESGSLRQKSLERRIRLVPRFVVVVTQLKIPMRRIAKRTENLIDTLPLDAELPLSPEDALDGLTAELRVGITEV